MPWAPAHNITFANLHIQKQVADAYLKSWWAAAPVDLHQVNVTDALVEAGAGQTGVTLGQHLRVHIA